MKKVWLAFFCVCLFCFIISQGAVPEKEEQQARKTEVNQVSKFAEEMASRLSNKLHVKNIVGEPFKVGNVTIIPVIMIDVGYGGGAGGMTRDISPLGSGFYMSGEAKPLGFIVVSKKGSEFISLGEAPRK